MVFVDSHRGHNCTDTPFVLTALLTSCYGVTSSQRHTGHYPCRTKIALICLKTAVELSADGPLRRTPQATLA